MKKCAHCGLDNPDAAYNCTGCGKQEFIGDTPVVSDLSHAPNGLNQALIKILISVGIFLVVTSITLHVAWQEGNSSIAWYQQKITWRTLQTFSNSIAAYQKKYHTTPASIDQLKAMTNEVPDSEYLPFEGLKDGWRNPYIITNYGSNLVVISYGRDGKPGGTGVDCDLTSVNPHPLESVPTFSQFWANPEMGGMIKSSIICGVLAGILSLFTIRIPALNRRTLLVLALKLFLTLIGTLYITSIITAVHVPSGH